MKTNKTTPLKQLKARKAALNILSKGEEQKICGLWADIKSNAGSIILSGAKDMIFPKSKKKASKKNKGTYFVSSIIDYIPYFIPSGRTMYLGRTIAIPILLRWIKKRFK